MKFGVSALLKPLNHLSTFVPMMARHRLTKTWGTTRTNSPRPSATAGLRDVQGPIVETGHPRAAKGVDDPRRPGDPSVGLLALC